MRRRRRGWIRLQLELRLDLFVHPLEAQARLREVLPELRRVVLGHVQRQGASRADADDVTQEILIEVWLVDLPRWKPGSGRLLPWIMRKTRWRAIDWLRKRASSPEETGHCLDEVAAGLHQVPLDFWAHEERAAHEAQADLVARARACASLSVRQEVILDAWLEGRSQRATAAELGVAPSNVCRAQARAIVAVAESLDAIGRSGPSATKRVAIRV